MLSLKLDEGSKLSFEAEDLMFRQDCSANDKQCTLAKIFSQEFPKTLFDFSLENFFDLPSAARTMYGLVTSFNTYTEG